MTAPEMEIKVVEDPALTFVIYKDGTSDIHSQFSRADTARYLRMAADQLAPPADASGGTR